MENSPILDSLKIQATPLRICVLKIILKKAAEEFTTEEVLQACLHEETGVKTTKMDVNKVMKLYQVRGLLELAGDRRVHAKGRPELLFRLCKEKIAASLNSR